MIGQFEVSRSHRAMDCGLRIHPHNQEAHAHIRLLSRSYAEGRSQVQDGRGLEGTESTVSKRAFALAVSGVALYTLGAMHGAVAIL